MSAQNNNSESEQNSTSEVSVSFDTFQSFYKDNPSLDNAEYYQQFPSVNQGTIRSWKAKAKSISSEVPPVQQGTPQNRGEDPYMEMLINELIVSTRVDPNTLKGLDKRSQIQVLQNIKKNQSSNPDPNMKMYTPSTGKTKTPFDQYIKIDEKAFREKGFGRVEIILPASVAHDPELNKKLRL